jgi:hypothetical protein
MGDPLAAAAHVRRSLAPDGTFLLVEPAAGDRVEDNLNPVGRIFYSASLFICVPNARSQGGEGLGSQVPEATWRSLLAEASFSQVRRAAETPVQPGVRGPPVATAVRTARPPFARWAGRHSLEALEATITRLPSGSATSAMRSPQGWSAGSAMTRTPCPRRCSTAASQSSAYTQSANRWPSATGSLPPASGSAPMPRCDRPRSRAT